MGNVSCPHRLSSFQHSLPEPRYSVCLKGDLESGKAVLSSPLPHESRPHTFSLNLAHLEATLTSLPRLPSLFTVGSQKGLSDALFLFQLQATAKESDFQDGTAPPPVLRPLFTCFIGELRGVILLLGALKVGMLCGNRGIDYDD